MSTEYRLKYQGFYDGDGDLDIAIGQKSHGWVFKLYIYPEIGIDSLEDWKELFKGGVIYSDINDRVSRDILLDLITDPSEFPGERDEYYLGEDYLEENQSEIGPRNLLREQVGIQTMCVGHEEFYDVIIGDIGR